MLRQELESIKADNGAEEVKSRVAKLARLKSLGEGPESPALYIPEPQKLDSPIKPLPSISPQPPTPSSRLPRPPLKTLLRTPLQALRTQARTIQVSSPVAEYVRSNPAPCLVRNIQARGA